VVTGSHKYFGIVEFGLSPFFPIRVGGGRGLGYPPPIHMQTLVTLASLGYPWQHLCSHALPVFTLS